MIMTEITEGLRIYLDECAADVNVIVSFYPTAHEVNLTTDRVAIIREPLLPGHCLEFKYNGSPTSQQQQSVLNVPSNTSEPMNCD